MVLRKSFYIRWSAGRSPRVHEVNPGRDPSVMFKTKSGGKTGESSENFPCNREIFTHSENSAIIAIFFI